MNKSVCCTLIVILLLSGCGVVADKNRIVIATLDGEDITRGDLFKIIREMENNKRPIIKNKSDLLRVLNQHINDQIKIPLGRKMDQEKILNVPWENALQVFFAQSGEQLEYYQMVWNMEIPEDGQTTPLMDVYNMTPKQIAALKAIIAQEVDFLREKILGEQAVMKLVKDDINNKEINYDQADLEREYNLQKNKLKKFEWMRIIGLRFPTDVNEAEQAAATVSDRLTAGESFDNIISEVRLKDPGRILESEIENNPDLAKFKGFWHAASGADIDAILGPVYLPEYTMQMQDAQGNVTAQTMPDAYVIFKILEREDERQLTLEESRTLLLPELLLSQKLSELRAQHGVQIFMDKLPDPAQFSQEDPYAELDKINTQ